MQTSKEIVASLQGDELALYRARGTAIFARLDAEDVLRVKRRELNAARKAEKVAERVWFKTEVSKRLTAAYCAEMKAEWEAKKAATA